MANIPNALERFISRYITDNQLDPTGVDTDDVKAKTVEATETVTDPSGVDHTSQLADDGDAQPPEGHGNSAHSTNFAPDGHGNASHSASFTTTGENIENFSTSGGSGTVPTSDGSGNVSMDSVSPDLSLSFNEVTDNRSGNTQYTNNTGNVLVVVLTIQSQGEGEDLYVGGVQVTDGDNADSYGLIATAFVPDGSTYKYDASLEFGDMWTEYELVA